MALLFVLSSKLMDLFYINELPPTLSPKVEDSNHTGRLLFGTFINWVGSDEAARGETKTQGREGGLAQIRANERNDEGTRGDAMACDRKGTRGGLIIEFPGGFMPISRRIRSSS